MNPQIVAIGIATVDHLYLLENVADLPEGCVLAHSVQGGGMAATALAASAQLGASTAAVLCVGDDARGGRVLQELGDRGIDVSMCRRKAGETPPVTVLVDAKTAERHFLPLRCESPLPGPEDVDWDLAKTANVFLVDSCTREPKLVLKRAQEFDLTTMVDKEFQPGNEPQWVSDVDIYIGGSDRPEWRQAPEKALDEARRLLGLGPHTAILTLGSAGCVGVGPEGEFHIPAFEVDVVDTCGAGDVFRGGYAWALEQGWRARHCATFASATSAICATELGGRAGLPGAQQVAELLVANNQEGPWQACLGNE